MNTITVVGHIGTDAELRHTSTGAAVASFSLASNDGPKDKQRTVWFRVSVWRDFGEKLAPYLTKGTQIMVVGSIDMEPRIWTDQQGNTRSGIDVTAQRIRLLGGGQRDNGGHDDMPTSIQGTDDIPW